MTAGTGRILVRCLARCNCPLDFKLRRAFHGRLCGPPAQVIETSKEFEARYPGLDQTMIHWAEGIPPEEFKDQLRRFASEVMPAFRGDRSRNRRASA